MRERTRDELVAAHLDGRLDAEQGRAFERRLAEDPGLAAEVALGRRIEASLRATFRVPERPGAAAGRVVAAASPPAARLAWRRRAAALLAAAAVVVLVARFAVDGAPQPTAPSPGEPGGPGASGALCPVGPLASVGTDGAPMRVASPDLATLYDEAVAFSRPRTLVCGPRDDLAGALAANYGEAIVLRPEAANMLHGPYASAEWPTGTILTGFPEEHTAVLVAELDATHRCCIRPELAPDSGLQTFTWRVGGLVLTEITPLAEPRLLEYFQAGG